LRTCQGPSQYPTPYSPAALSATEMKEFEEKAAVTIVRQDDEDLSTIVDVDEVSDTNCQNGSAEDVSIVSVIDPREHVVSASSTSLSLHTDFSNKENIPLPPPSPLSPDKSAILSGDPQRCYVPASPPRPSSTDAVDSRNSSTAAGVLNSILWPFNRKLRNSSPFGDIYSPLNALRIMRSRSLRAARLAQYNLVHPVATAAETADRCKRRVHSQKANQLNAETSNQRKATDKQSACQPSNLPWYMKADVRRIYFSLRSMSHVEFKWVRAEWIPKIRTRMNPAFPYRTRKVAYTTLDFKEGDLTRLRLSSRFTCLASAYLVRTQAFIAGRTSQSVLLVFLLSTII
uniref:Pecanex-like protein n=1 Tax=Schistocephalus solidus TaxID=70667 RepID=A0A183T0C5_SCHSO